jgi:hypothetical protein
LTVRVCGSLAYTPLFGLYTGNGLLRRQFIYFCFHHYIILFSLEKKTMKFPSFNDQVVTAYEHDACLELSHGYIFVSGAAEKLSTLGMIVKKRKIINFDQFKLE